MKLKFENNKLYICNNNKSLLLKLGNNIHRAIVAYIEFKLANGNKNEIEFKLSAQSAKGKYIIFNEGYRILIDDLTYHELSNRMILLNNKIVFPKVNVEKSIDEEENE